MNYIKERSKGKGEGAFTSEVSSKADYGEFSITCCHCNHVFFFQRGSGKEREWCSNCAQVSCGDTRCSQALNGCVAFEKKLERYERVNRYKAELGGVIIGSLNG